MEIKSNKRKRGHAKCERERTKIEQRECNMQIQVENISHSTFERCSPVAREPPSLNNNNNNAKINKT